MLKLPVDARAMKRIGRRHKPSCILISDEGESAIALTLEIFNRLVLHAYVCI